MASEKIQPWKAHWTPQSGNPNAVAYQEKKGFEIIADGGREQTLSSSFADHQPNSKRKR
jgi:hypothetical protein